MPIWLLPLILLAPPAVKLPAEVQVAPGRVVVIRAETGGEVVRWATLAEGVDLVPFPDGKAAIFCSPTPGRFAVLAWTAAGNLPSEAARVVVVVGTPPIANGFVEDVTRLVAAETDRDALKRLASAYRAAVELGGKPEVATAGQLAEQVRDLVRSALPDAALIEIRKRVARESATRLPAEPDAPLTPEVRAAAAQLYAEIATILEGK